MAIKISMTLEGTEVIESKIESMDKKFGEFSKTVGDIGKQSGVGVSKIVEDLKKAGLSLDETSDKSVKFGSQLKLLQSALRLVGVEVGSFGAAARLLNASLALTGAGIVGGIIVALGKLEEAAAKTQAQLADAFGSQGKGQAAFAALEKQALAFGTSVTSLAPGLIALESGLNNINRAAKGFVALRPQDLPAALAAPNINQTTEAYNNFLKILRAGQATTQEAAQTASTFFSAFKFGEPITSAALKGLPTGALKELQKALGDGGLSAAEFFAKVDKGTLTLDKLVIALSKLSPAVKKALDAKAIDTMGDALDRVLVKLEAGLKGATGEGFSEQTISFLKSTEDELDLIAAAYQAIINKAKEWSAQAEKTRIELEVPGAIAEPPLPKPRPEALDNLAKFKTGAIDASKSLENLGAAGLNMGNKVAQGASTGANALKDLTTQANLTDDQIQQILEKGGTIEGGGGQAAKGRLGQIPVFVPQLAGAGGEQSGQEFGQQWVQAVQQEIQATDIEFDINTQIDEQQRTLQLNFDENAVNSEAQVMWENIKQILQQTIQLNLDVGSGSTGIGGTPFASGGLVKGPGSTTSDSIFALLSNREWVINAKAVDFYGSNLFAALNSMRLPRNLIGAAPKFAEGGQVTAPQSSLTLVLGGRSFEATAGEGTVKSLRRFAVNSQLASIGRKPGFVR